MIDKKKKYRLHASRVDRIAIVDRPAVPDAEIVAYKRRKDEGESIGLEGAISYQDLPLAEKDRSWSADKAVERIKEWAVSSDKKEIDWEKYRKAFMWYDSSNKENSSSYKLPYADVIDGKLKAIPRALTSVIQVLSGAGGGVDIPKEDKIKILNQCKKYYEKIEMDFPEISIKVLEKQGDLLEINFMQNFIFKASQAAIDSLQDSVWNALYSETASNFSKSIEIAFEDFHEVVKNFLAKLSRKVKKDDENKLTTKDVAKAFASGLAISAMSETFSYFRSSLPYLLLGIKSLAEPEETLTQVINQFKDFVMKNGTEIVVNKRELEVSEKTGRTISRARLNMLKEAVSVLTDIIGEAESRYDKSKKEENNMEIKELVEKFEKFSTDVEGLISDMTLVKNALKEKGIALTEEEKKEAQETEKKAKAQKLSEKAKELGLKEEASEEAINKALEEKAEKEKQEKEALEKKAQEEATEKEKKQEERLQGIEKGLEKVGKFIEVVSKRMGVKSSLDLESITTEKNFSDPFADALTGKNK